MTLHHALHCVAFTLTLITTQYDAIDSDCSLMLRSCVWSWKIHWNWIFHVLQAQRNATQCNARPCIIFWSSLIPRPSHVFQRFTWKLGKAWSILWCNDNVLDAVWATVGDLRPLAHAMLSSQIHTDNGAAARCTSQGVWVKRTGQQNDCRRSLGSMLYKAESLDLPSTV